MSAVPVFACPRDHAPLAADGNFLACPQGHRYPVVEGIPVLLVDDVEQTIGIARTSIEAAGRAARGERVADPWFLQTLGITLQEREAIVAIARAAHRVDPVVQFMVGATNGILYKELMGKLEDYPIPELRMPHGNGESLLDVGCNWGRWSLAAARLGYRVVGIDPSLGAVLAARRVASQFGLDATFVVADARYLPFHDASFDHAFSYSVLQHLSKDDAKCSFAQMGRVLKPGGTSLVQMPNRFGVRCLYHQARRGFREPHGFEVRYWAPGELTDAFDVAIGPTRLSVDCYFGIGLQASDAHLMPPMRRLLIGASERLRAASECVPGLKGVADSLYVASTRATR